MIFRTNVSSNSSSSLNLSDSDKDPCLTSNEADDEQSDWPKEESSAPHKKSWRKDHEDEASENNDDDNDNEMLTSSNRTLQKFVNSAFNMMLTNSKYTIQNRIKTFANRQFLTGDRKHAGSKVQYDSNKLLRTVKVDDKSPSLVVELSRNYGTFSKTSING